jgi:penicillin-binding protein 1A
LSKKEILSSSISTAPIWAAALSARRRRRSSISARSITDVNLAESAMLAGLFKAPAKYAPHVNLPAARARANEVLS